MTVNCDRRAPSTSATQSLDAHEQRLRPEPRRPPSPGAIASQTPAGSASDQLARQAACAWQLVYQRPITAEEAAWARAFAAQQLDARRPVRRSRARRA